MSNWKVTYEKVVSSEKLDKNDWQVLCELLERRFLSTKKRWLKDTMLRILYSCKNNQLDEIMKATQIRIQFDYIPLLMCTADKDQVQHVALMKRGK